MFINTLFAGPICTGFWGCLPLTLVVYIYTLLPISAVVTAAFIGIFRVLKKRLPSKRWIAAVATLSLPVVYFAYSGFSQASMTRNYQAKQVKKAAAIGLQLYEPAYVVPGYDLAENAVSYSKTLTYKYFDRSTQVSPEASAKRAYSVEVQRPSAHPRQSVYDAAGNIPPILASKTIAGTTITVAGTISSAEADKILASLRQVSADKINFHTDWPESR